jgi:hypothetical protein
MSSSNNNVEEYDDMTDKVGGVNRTAGCIIMCFALDLSEFWNAEKGAGASISLSVS